MELVSPKPKISLMDVRLQSGDGSVCKATIVTSSICAVVEHESTTILFTITGANIQIAEDYASFRQRFYDAVDGPQLH